LPDQHADALPSDRTGLSVRDRRLLELQARTFRYVRAKEGPHRDALGTPRTAHYVRPHALLPHPQAMRCAPPTINRLRDRRPSAARPARADHPGRVAWPAAPVGRVLLHVRRDSGFNGPVADSQYPYPPDRFDDEADAAAFHGAHRAEE